MSIFSIQVSKFHGEVFTVLQDLLAYIHLVFQGSLALSIKMRISVTKLISIRQHSTHHTVCDFDCRGSTCLALVDALDGTRRERTLAYLGVKQSKQRDSSMMSAVLMESPKQKNTDISTAPTGRELGKVCQAGEPGMHVHSAGARMLRGYRFLGTSEDYASCHGYSVWYHGMCVPST
jgi:hypothetical protein